MTFLSEFMRLCDSRFENHGFDRAAFIALLGASDDAAPPQPPAPPAAKWERGLYLRQWFAVFEAACIIEGKHPDVFDGYSDYNIPSSIESMRQAIADSLPELETDNCGRVSHKSIKAWCIASGIDWPLMQGPQAQPVAGAADAANLARRLAEAELNAERLAQEVAAITAERDRLHNELQGLAEELVCAKKDAAQNKADLQQANADLLQGKSRTSALKLVGGMAISGFGLSIHDARLNGITGLRNDLDRVGITISEDVIRASLKAAAEIIDPPKPSQS